ncbi:DoxX family protein [Hymenobacter sp. ASUV-10]|uniref:DoxX family protein n=1 Tax=Hymenobacter aranciens TaxID=3063996 RepID=A0ABT9BHP4_9BACT|nr:DoxX family protein [Hymenobacter sp. ASUV-10]MDO7877193.1 DoxX family protein [Hymenobacter sp. ASUV-10]
MSPKTLNILYWSLTILFALLMLMDGGAGLAQEVHGQESMRLLGYPLYIMYIMGAAKVLGAAALLQPWFRTVKEWAYAGFAFNFIGAAASQVLAGAGWGMAVPALVMLAVLLLIYFLWKKHEAARTV